MRYFVACHPRHPGARVRPQQPRPGRPPLRRLDPGYHLCPVEEHVVTENAIMTRVGLVRRIRRGASARGVRA